LYKLTIGNILLILTNTKLQNTTQLFLLLAIGRSSSDIATKIERKLKN